LEGEGERGALLGKVNALHVESSVMLSGRGRRNLIMALMGKVLKGLCISSWEHAHGERGRGRVRRCTRKELICSMSVNGVSRGGHQRRDGLEALGAQ